MVPAIVLAAGASSRMGRPKALLEVRGRTFVRRILEALREAGITDAVVVVRPGAVALAAEVAATTLARVVENPEPDRGQLSSLIVGLDAVDRPEVTAALVTLVDVPLVRPSTFATLVARAGGTASPILRATHDGRHGHPVLFAREVFGALRAADPAAGAKPVMRAFTVEDVAVDDPGVLRDVDTPADYDALAT